MTIAKLKPLNVQLAPQDDRVMSLACDAGNRSIKWCSSVGSIRTIPSIHKDLEEWDSPISDRSSVVIEYEKGISSLESQRWVVGSLASDMGGQHTFLDEKAFLAQKLVLAAIEPHPDKPQIAIDRLITCLPNELQAEKVAAIKDGLTGVHSFQRNGIHVIAQIRNVEVQPETLGAYRWAVQNRIFRYARPNAILDLGGKTSIGQVYSKNGSLIRESRLILPGTYALAQMVAKHPLLIKSDNTADLAVIMDAIANNSLAYGSTGISFKDKFPNYLNTWLTDIRNRLKIGWAKWLPELGETLIIGGSADLAIALAEQTQGRFKICPEPQMANCRGMLVRGA
jgi:hypothetical protein